MYFITEFNTCISVKKWLWFFHPKFFMPPNISLDPPLLLRVSEVFNKWIILEGVQQLCLPAGGASRLRLLKVSHSAPPSFLPLSVVTLSFVAGSRALTEKR